MVNRHRYFQTLFCCLILAAFGAQAQTTVQAHRVIAKDSLKIGSRWVYLVDPDSTFSITSHRAIPTTKAVRDFVLNNATATDTIYVLAGAGGAPDTICISGPHCAVLPEGLTAAEVGAIISDSLATLPGTNLTFSGASSPVSLNSSTGTGVSFLAGTGIGLSQAGNQLTVNNTGVTGSGTNPYLAYWSGSSAIASNPAFRVNTGTPALEVYGSYASNSTFIQFNPGGANPIIATATTNNGMLMRLGQGNLEVQRNSDNSPIFMVTRHTQQGYINGAFLVGGTSTYPARLTTRGTGTSSATYSFIAENSSGTDAMLIDDAGGVFVPTRSGTATGVGGFNSSNKITNVSLEPGLTLTGGTLYVNRDSFPNFNDISSDNIGNTNLSLTSNRVLTATGYSFEVFKEDNDYTLYDLFSNFYERIGQDTFTNLTDTTYNFPIVGKSFSVTEPNKERYGKIYFGEDPDWNFGPQFGGYINRKPNFDDGGRTNFMYSSAGYSYWASDYDTTANRIEYGISKADGITFERRGTGIKYMNLSKNGANGSFDFSQSGMVYDGDASGNTTINDYILTNPYPTDFPTALAGWSTAGTGGVKYLSHIELGNLAFTDDTLNAFVNLTLTGTTSPIEIGSSDGGATVVLIAGSGIGLAGSGGGSILTITNTGDQSASNELQTISNSSDATSHTVTLSSTGGSVQFVEGTGVTLTTSGTASAGVVTIAASGATGEANTASNLGAGAGAFEGKVSLDLQFNSFVSESPTTLTIAEDDPNNTIDFTINTGAVTNGAGTLTTGDQVYDFTIAQGYLTAETDGSVTNEGSLTVGAGTGTTSLINSNTSGSTAVTLEAGSNITLSETGNTITIAATGGATDLTFTGASSPYTLNSSTGTDVTFTAGEGISITRNTNDLTIAAPVMTAASGGGAGVVGIVPAPAAGENIEFLRGDATWGAVEYVKGVTVETPGSSENLTLLYTRKAITIREVADVVRGTSPSVTWQIKYATTRDSGTPTDLFSASRTTTSTSGATTTTFNDATIGAGNWLWLVTSATSGTNDEISIQITYTID